MKRLLFFSMLLLGLSVCGKSQAIQAPGDTVRVVLENDKVKVTEHISTGGNDVCGSGMHHHDPHLTILLTDASVILTTEDGKSQNYELKAGTTLWSEAETHMAVNNGNQAVKVYLIDVK